jgi:hypothetical protein
LWGQLPAPHRIRNPSKLAAGSLEMPSKQDLNSNSPAQCAQWPGSHHVLHLGVLRLSAACSSGRVNN